MFFRIIGTVLSIIFILSLFSGCEKNDYQHPMYRSGAKSK